MASGGARNRSGPPKDPNSGRSDRDGVSFATLPATYAGAVPVFPLPSPTEREIELWAEAWTWPQANFWSLPSESWRQRTVALWVRTSVRCEEPDAGASLLGQLHRFADQAALTTAGLAEVGLSVAPDEVSEKRDEKSDDSRPKSSRDRMKLVKGNGA